MLHLVLSAALAASYTPLKPKSPASWISGDDYPGQLLADGKSALVGVMITVTPEGKARRCEILRTSGIPEVDSYTCGLMMKRARYSPALDPTGNRIFGVQRLHLVWATAPGLIEDTGDFAIKVDELPAASKKLERIAFSVDEHGNLGWCGPSDPKDHGKLAKVACDGMANYHPIDPAEDDGGQPVASVQDALVQFVAAAAFRR